jgi:hypothetical protein
MEVFYRPEVLTVKILNISYVVNAEERNDLHLYACVK